MGTEAAAKDSVRCTIAPWLSVRGSATAVEFYKAAFGAAEVFRLEDSSGSVVARLMVDGAEFWVGLTDWRCLVFEGDEVRIRQRTADVRSGCRMAIGLAMAV